MEKTGKFEFTTRERVRYGDCDMHQHLNHARYLTFLEQARVVYCAALGMKPSSDFHSIPFIIASAHCDYKAPAHLNDEIVIDLGTTAIGNKSFRIDYEMRLADDNTLIATAYTVQVMYDYDRKKSVPVPVWLKESIGRLKKGGVP